MTKSMSDKETNWVFYLSRPQLRQYSFLSNIDFLNLYPLAKSAPAIYTVLATGL